MQPQNLEDVKVDHYNCFFSEIREVSHCQLHHKDTPKVEINNCYAALQDDQLLIISRGGTRFHLPMDQQVTGIYPLAEGLLIQFSIRPEVRLAEILHFQRNKHSMDIEELSQTEQGKYCYATLTRHPYNPLKLLG